jgi:hypothetical protein
MSHPTPPQTREHLIHYAGLADDDPRGQWAASDVAGYVFTRSDEVSSYRQTSPNGDTFRVERMDGASIEFTLVSEYEGLVDGYTYTAHTPDGVVDVTGGDAVTEEGDLALLADTIFSWAATPVATR